MTEPAATRTRGPDGRRWWPARLAGLGAFSIVWIGQVVTLIGSAAARFAFIIEIWTRTRSTTMVVLLSFAMFLPRMLLTPGAGAIVDRCSRRTTLRLADLGGLAAVSSLLLVYYVGGLHTWQIYAATALAGTAEAFQLPALAAAVPQLVRRDQMQRANGLIATARSVSDVAGPPLGAALLVLSGLGSVLSVDALSFLIALGCLTIVRMPGGAGRSAASRPNLLSDSATGLRYLWTQPSMRALLTTFFVVSVATVFGLSILSPMVLARTGNDATSLAVTDMAIGIGGIAGGMALLVWGGPRNRVRGMLLAIIAYCVCTHVLMAVGRHAAAWAAAGLVGASLVPLINASFQAILQSKVPTDIQGRVFAAFFFLMQVAALLGMCLSGPLADHVFEPWAASNPGRQVLGPIVGHGPGGGMAGMLFLAGVCGIAAAVAGLSRHRVRDIDILMPDIVAGRDGTAEPTREWSAT